MVHDRPDQGSLSGAGTAQNKRQRAGQCQFHSGALLFGQPDTIDLQLFRNLRPTREWGLKDMSQVLGGGLLVPPQQGGIQSPTLQIEVLFFYSKSS